MNILSKKQNYQLWQSGAFGNKLRAWRTVDEYLASDFNGQVALRVLLPAGNGPCWYDLDRLDVSSVVTAWTCRGINRDAIMVNEMAPSERTLLQGEYYNGAGCDGSSDHFFYSQVARPMRIALTRGYHTSGLRSRLLIRNVMTPASYDDWQELLEQYPDHVFEVSIFDCCLGDLPNRNALVWEIRRY